MNLVAISAKKRCGKDTAAQFIIEQLGNDIAKSYALADPIKRALYFGLLKTTTINHVTGKLYTYPELNGENGFDREMNMLISDSIVIQILKEAWNYTCDRNSSVKKLKMNGVLRIHEFVHKNPNQPWSIRRLMQTFGTDIGVHVDKVIWMRFMSEVYIEAIRDNITLIITDCRQDHEMDMMRSMGAKVIHIDRPGYSDTSSDCHITEKGLNRNINDIVIVNDSSLGKFKNDILNAIK